MRSIPADLYLTPVPGLSREHRRGPERLVGTGRRRGWLPRLEGPLQGELDVLLEGVHWRPGRRPKRKGYTSFRVEWGSIAGADVVPMFYEVIPVKTLLTIITTAGEQLDFSIPRQFQADLKETLGEYLTAPGPPRTY